VRIFKSLAAVVVLLGICCQPSEACACSVTQLSARDDAERVFKDASVVFEGEILSTEPAKQADLSEFSPQFREELVKREPVAGEITFRVLRQYKGAPPSEIRIYTGARNSAEPCQATYHQGDRWFIYGFLKKDGKLYFTDCNRSTTLDAAGAEVRYARGEPATEEDLMPREEKSRVENEPELKENGATLSGTIRRFDRASMGRSMLTIWRVDEEDPKERPGGIDQDASPDGSFVVRYLWPGSYFLSARVIDMDKPSFFVGRTETFTVKERQSLNSLEIVLNAEPMAEVRIHIEPSKALHDQVEAELWDVDNDSEAVNPKLYPDNQNAEPDSSGLAVLKAVQYGTYHLSVSNFVINDTGYRVEAACHETNDKLLVKVDKPIVEITVHLDCKQK
jgi:hypothetical protein